MTTLAIWGAAGNMGTRTSNAFRNDPDYRILHVEPVAAGQEKLKQRGDTPTPADEAAAQADVVILAIADKHIASVACDIVPQLKPGAMVMTLDPAAAYAGKLPPRDDITYFVAHPAHPPLFNDEQTMDARRDYFGSGLAKQAIVAALMQGPEEHYELGVTIASRMWGPVLRVHRVTVEQMAILEPALSETVGATCIAIVREAMDEAIRRGVPAEAARDFILGHLNVELAILFDEIDWDFSEGAKLAIEQAKKEIFQPDWKKVFEPEHLKKSVDAITSP